MFDQRLKSHLLEAFSYIEISIRTQWAYQLSYGFGHGEYAHRNAVLFNRFHADNLDDLQRSYDRITNRRGVNFHTRPIWDVIHVMSFGQLSKWYSSLVDRAMRRSIAQNYGMDQSVLHSALRHLTKVRNICAHHQRLWDINVASGLKIPNTLGSDPETVRAFNKQAPFKIYNAVVLITHLMEVITPNGDWPERFLELKDKDSCGFPPEADMGFLANWREHAIWQRHL